MNVYGTNKYRVKLKHDNGTVLIDVWAYDVVQAIKEVCSMEGAPESAILEIKRIQKGVKV